MLRQRGDGNEVQHSLFSDIHMQAYRYICVLIQNMVSRRCLQSPVSVRTSSYALSRRPSVCPSRHALPSYCTGRMTDPTAKITPNALPVPAAALNACCSGIRFIALCSPTTVPPTSAPIPKAMAATLRRLSASVEVVLAAVWS